MRKQLLQSAAIFMLFLFLCCKDKNNTGPLPENSPQAAENPGTNDNNEVLMAYFPLAPHINLSKNDTIPLGPAVDYIETVFREMGYKIRWVRLPFPRILEGLKEGSLDGCQFFSKSPQRESFIHYPDHVFFSAQPHLVFSKNYRIDTISSVNDIKGLRIGYIKDAQPSSFIQEHLNVVVMDNVPSGDAFRCNMEKIKAGRIDAMLSLNKLTVRYNAAKLGMLNQIKMVDLPEPPDYMYIVFSKNSPKGDNLLQKYNEFMNKDGKSYNNYIDEYFYR